MPVKLLFDFAVIFFFFFPQAFANVSILLPDLK